MTSTSEKQAVRDPSMQLACAAMGITSPEAIDALCGIAVTRRLKKGEHLVEQGEMPRCIAFVLSGVMRTFYVDAQGKEVTDCLIDRIDLPVVAAADLHSPSLETVEALTSCNLVSLDIEELERLVATSLPVAVAYIKIMDRAWKIPWTMRTIVCQQDARGRYEWFLQEYPGLIDRIPHYYVASFLSITPVTLSRVRRALMREEGAEGAGGAA